MSDVTTATRDISELTPTAQKACRLFLEKCKANGLDIFVTETYRSQERQNYLYSLGRTREGNKVTWTKSGRHTSRRAWDIACNGGVLYDTVVLAACGRVAEKLGITWGGNWNTPDTPHFEVAEDWRYNEEDEPMTETEKAKIQAIDDSLTNLHRIVEDLIKEMRAKDVVYNTIDEVPEWARPTIQKLIDEGKLNGTGDTLALSADLVRVLVIMDR